MMPDEKIVGDKTIKTGSSFGKDDLAYSIDSESQLDDATVAKIDQLRAKGYKLSQIQQMMKDGTI